MRHIVDYRSPLVLHPVLLKRYYPYLDDDASGHFQVGRGYNKTAPGRCSATSNRGTSSASTPPSPHLAGPVARCLPQLPRQQGSLPAQHRRLMRRRLASRRPRWSSPASRRAATTTSPVRPLTGASLASTSVTQVRRHPRQRRRRPGRRHRRRACTVDPVTDLADWQPLPGSAEDTVTTNGDWTLTVTGTDPVQPRGPSRGSASAEADRRHRISDAFIDGAGRWWFLRTTRRPTGHGPGHRLGPAAATSRSTALRRPHDLRRLLGVRPRAARPRHVRPDGGYCLATVDLVSSRTSTLMVRPNRHGFNGARITPQGRR